MKIIRDPALEESLWNPQWIDPAGSSPEEVTALMRRESEKWSRTMKAAAIELE